MSAGAIWMSQSTQNGFGCQTSKLGPNWMSGSSTFLWCSFSHMMSCITVILRQPERHCCVFLVLRHSRINSTGPRGSISTPTLSFYRMGDRPWALLVSLSLSQSTLMLPAPTRPQGKGSTASVGGSMQSSWWYTQNGVCVFISKSNRIRDFQPPFVGFF